MSIKIYTACKMTGRDKAEMVKMAHQNKKIFEAAGIQVLDPVIAEHVKPTHNELQDVPIHTLKGYWKRDKAMIREAHVVVDTTPEMKSEGSSHEIGYARYALWKPVVRMYTGNENKPLSPIVYFEDDLIVHSVEEAAIQIQKYWGTWARRAMWRVSLLNRCLLKWIWWQVKEFK